MKFIIGICLLLSLQAAAQSGDAITGKWLKANKEDLIIEVFKEQGTYKGRINWSKDNSKPVGFIMLDKLTYNQNERLWEGGEIHDPKSGRTYNAGITLQPDGTIEITGKLLFFKSTRLFKRVK